MSFFLFSIVIAHFKFLTLILIISYVFFVLFFILFFYIIPSMSCFFND